MPDRHAGSRDGAQHGGEGRVPAPGLEPGQQTPKDCGLPITPCRTKATDRDGGRRKRRSYCLRYRSGPRIAKRAVCRGGGHPTLDPPIERGTAADIYPQASVVVLAYVGSHRLRVVSLQHRTAELARLHACEFQSAPLCCFRVRVLVDVHAEYQVVPWDSGDIQESEEERDQRWIAIDEDHPVVAPMRLVLHPLAPIGQGTRHEDLTVGEFPDLGCGTGALSRAPLFADFTLDRSVSMCPFSRASPDLFVAEPRRDWQVAHPQRD